VKDGHLSAALTYTPVLKATFTVINRNMFRTAFLAASRSVSRPLTRRPAALLRLPQRQALQNLRVFAPVVSVKAVRCYASGPAVLSKEEITGRILDLLKNFDKV
jgi:NADH dehydrogenase (ubiquinone) 1 alpha/beta subcomplex 1, acyl-carrier protein